MDDSHATPKHSAVPPRELSTPELLAALGEPFPPSPRPAAYHLRLAALAAVVVALPALLATLVLAIALAWWWWWCQVRGMEFGNTTGTGVILVRVTPLIIGPFLILFLLKPILARHPRPPESHPLDPEGEPRLFAFVDRLCVVLDAPKPDRIVVDLQVNAGVTMERKWRNLLRRELLLTIGLPLVASMRLRELAAVLAHEIGHLSQRSGLQLGVTFHRVILWYARLVEQRDSWDAALMKPLRTGCLPYFAIAIPALGCVALTRALLRSVLRLGLRVSTALSRQMELDADRHAVRLCGPEVVRRNELLLHELTAAAAMANHLQESAWQEGRLADDLPELVRRVHGQMEEEARAQLHSDVLEAKTDVYDTHPSARQRIERAEAAATPAVFTLEHPARELFADWEELARVITREGHAQILGTPSETAVVVPATGIAEGLAVLTTLGENIDEYFRGVPLGPVTLGFEAAEFSPVSDVAAATARLREARARLEAAREEAVARLQRQEKLEDRLCILRGFVLATKGGRRPRTGDPGIDRLSIAGAREEARTILEELEELDARAGEDGGRMRERISLALALASTPEVRSRLGDAAPRGGEAIEAVRVVRRLQPASEKMRPLVRRYFTLSFAGMCLDPEGDGSGSELLFENPRGMAAATKAVRSALEGIDYPFPTERGSSDLASHLFGDPFTGAESPSEVVDRTGIATRNWSELLARLMGEIAAAGLAIEDALGLPRLGPSPSLEEPRPSDEDGRFETV